LNLCFNLVAQSLIMNLYSKLILILLFSLSSKTYAQKQEFSNYYKVEKEIIILDFAFMIDSTNKVELTREEVPEVYEFIENEISNFFPELKRDFNSPFRLTFWNEDKEGEGRWETELSKFKYGSLWAMTRPWPAKIKELSSIELDFSKQFYLEIGPSLDFYKMLLAEPTHGEYGFEVSFGFPERVRDDVFYKNSIEAITPVYKEGFKELNKFIYDEVVTPVVETHPKKRGLHFVYWLSIDQEGNILEVKPSSNARSHQPDISIDIVSKIMEMPKWTPANKAGEWVKSQYELHIFLKPEFYDHLLSVEINVEK